MPSLAQCSQVHVPVDSRLVRRALAVQTAKKLRPAIDPIGRFPQLLMAAEGIFAAERKAKAEALPEATAEAAAASPSVDVQ